MLICSLQEPGTCSFGVAVTLTCIDYVDSSRHAYATDYYIFVSSNVSNSGWLPLIRTAVVSSILQQLSRAQTPHCRRVIAQRREGGDHQRGNCKSSQVFKAPCILIREKYHVSIDLVHHRVGGMCLSRRARVRPVSSSGGAGRVPPVHRVIFWWRFVRLASTVRCLAYDRAPRSSTTKVGRKMRFAWWSRCRCLISHSTSRIPIFTCDIPCKLLIDFG